MGSCYCVNSRAEGDIVDINNIGYEQTNQKTPTTDTVTIINTQNNKQNQSSSSSIILPDEIIPYFKTLPSQSQSTHPTQNKTPKLEIICDIINALNALNEFPDNHEIDDKHVTHDSNSDEALEAMNNNNRNNRNIAPNHNNNNNNNSTGSDRGESDDTKNDDSDSIPTDDEYDEEDTPLPTDDNFEIILNDDYDDDDEMDIQQLSNISFKCIQSASATQAGTSKGKSKTNQDSLIVLDSFGPSSLFQLYGVCDGHGPNGNHVAKFVTDNFPNILNNLLSSNNNCNQTLSITSILKQSFITIDSQLSQLQSQNELAFDINYSGTTATIGLFAGNKLYVANIGDSRTVLGKIPPKHKTVPISFALSNDHDPKNKSEMIRIKKSKSAKILYDDDDARIQIEIPEIIQNANLLSVGNVCNNSDKKTPKTKHRRTQSQVKKISASVSRSIGDKIAHKYGGLISQPEIIVHELSEADIFVIFASDGIWQMIDNDDVMRTVGTKLNQNKEVEMYADLQKTTSKLVREANISWQDEYEDYTDDITCVIARIGKIN